MFKTALTYDDVLLVPQYSEIESRGNVNLGVSLDDHKLLHPIVPANMKTVMTEKMARFILESGGLAILHRFCELDEVLKLVQLLSDVQTGLLCCSIGIGQRGYTWAAALAEAGVKALCIDVAHAHSKMTLELVKFISTTYPHIFLIVGNIATRRAAVALIQAGVKAVKIGIGSGCFVAGTLITMRDGTKKAIEAVEIGNYVITHTGEEKEVIDLFEKLVEDNLIKINDTLTCTPNHEIYVVEKKDLSFINDNNINEYAKWVPASELNENYLLIEIV